MPDTSHTLFGQLMQIDGGSMRRTCLALLLLIVSSAPTWADPTVDLSYVGGGIAQQEGDLWVRPGEAIDVYVVVRDGGALIDVEMSVYSWGAITSDGGHIHGGWGFGSLSPTSGSTANGGFRTRYTAGAGSSMISLTVSFFYGGQQWLLSTRNGVRVSQEQNDYDWIGTGNFILVGDTSTHPANHYGDGNFLGLLRTLALDYGNQWGLNLAYNDSSLVWGGVFDLNSNYSPPHNEHREGRSQDVRANGGPSSVPFNDEIRVWFVNRVRDLFGSTPLHESVGTGNEHYHIRG